MSLEAKIDLDDEARERVKNAIATELAEIGISPEQVTLYSLDVSGHYSHQDTVTLHPRNDS